MRRLLLALLVLTAACGVDVDGEPRSIPTDQVPFELLAPTSSTTTVVPAVTAAAEVFFVRSDRVAPVTRQVAAPPTVGTVMAALVQGPSAAEVDRGLGSAVNQETTVLSAEVANGVAVVNVSESFSRIGVRDQITALAQIVYTATALPGIDRVQILLNGVTVQVPRGDGTSTDTPLRRSDYSGLAPMNR